MRSLLAAAALLVPTPVATAVPDMSVVQTGAIVQVICPVTGGYSMGTAFRVGNGLLLTAKHVIAPGHCYVRGGDNVKVRYSTPDADFAMLAGDSGPFLKVDCGGFVKGRKYLAIGFARGLPFLTTVELTATGETGNGFAILAGIFTFVPGMSGGAVVDSETGKVVGVVNVYDMPRGLSGSVELKGTSVCKAA